MIVVLELTACRSKSGHSEDYKELGSKKQDY